MSARLGPQRPAARVVVALGHGAEVVLAQLPRGSVVQRGVEAPTEVLRGPRMLNNTRILVRKTCIVLYFVVFYSRTARI